LDAAADKCVANAQKKLKQDAGSCGLAAEMPDIGRSEALSNEILCGFAQRNQPDNIGEHAISLKRFNFKQGASH
jgi:hypothetical protein